VDVAAQQIATISLAGRAQQGGRMSTEFEVRDAERAASLPPDAARATLEPPATGDGAIDAVLTDLASAQDAPLAERIDAGERALAALQSRLNDLGGA
jgi:hypothetical protein